MLYRCTKILTDARTRIYLCAKDSFKSVLHQPAQFGSPFHIGIGEIGSQVDPSVGGHNTIGHGASGDGRPGQPKDRIDKWSLAIGSGFGSG
jgi:hypothetical protein